LPDDLRHSPVAVPEKMFTLRMLHFFDRGHSLSSLHPPPAAVASLPIMKFAYSAKDYLS